VGKTSHLEAKCVNISKTVADASKFTINDKDVAYAFSIDFG